MSMPANATSVAWPLAMSVPPTLVTNVRAQGDVGFVSAETLSTSGMLVKCTKAPTVDTVILMTVEADLYLGAA